MLTGGTAGYLTAEDNQAMLLMLGALVVALGQVINFWLGSTAERGCKAELIASALPKWCAAQALTLSYHFQENSFSHPATTSSG